MLYLILGSLELELESSARATEYSGYILRGEGWWEKGTDVGSSCFLSEICHLTASRSE